MKLVRAFAGDTKSLVVRLSDGYECPYILRMIDPSENIFVVYSRVHEIRYKLMMCRCATITVASSQAWLLVFLELGRCAY